MASRPHIDLTVCETKRITPNMQRIKFTGEDLASFQPGCESGYLKLIFSGEEANPNKKRLVRTYTIRKYNSELNELVMDFALHDHTEGPASRWAKNASVGDNLKVQGPGPVKLVDFSADWFFLVGDMTSLPAIACNLEQMPKDATGFVIVQINEEADKQELEVPEGIAIEWIINPEPHLPDEKLVAAVKAKELPEGRPSIWVACEFDNMKKLRSYFKDECNVGTRDIYVSSYWKIAATEDQHRQYKFNDAKSQLSLQDRIRLWLRRYGLVRKLMPVGR